MARPTEAHIVAATRLLATTAYTPSSSGPGVGASSKTAGAHAKLFLALAPILGTAGVHAIFSRSVKVARMEIPRLDELWSQQELPRDDEALARLLACLEETSDELGSSIATTVFASFFALLGTLIGEPLTRQIVKAALPALEQPRSEGTD